jgi:hypothetical protein
MTDHCFSRFPAAATATPTGVRESRATTLADVSRIAGVSVMAVSAALNGGRTSARVSARTRERILAVAACLGYRRNPVAHALASRRARRRRNTLAVAMAWPASSPVGPSGGFLGVLDGILSAAARHRHDTTLFILGEGWNDPARLREICASPVDGFIFVAPALADDAMAAFHPLVTLDANAFLPPAIDLKKEDISAVHGHPLFSLGCRAVDALIAKIRAPDFSGTDLPPFSTTISEAFAAPEQSVACVLGQKELQGEHHERIGNERSTEEMPKADALTRKVTANKG